MLDRGSLRLGTKAASSFQSDIPMDAVTVDVDEADKPHFSAQPRQVPGPCPPLWLGRVGARGLSSWTED